MRARLLSFLGVLAVASLVLIAANAGDKSEATLTIKGMSCGACANRIQNALLEMDGVHTATVSFEEGRATVTCDPSRVTTDQLVTTVEALGFTASQAGDNGSAISQTATDGLAKEKNAGSCSLPATASSTSEASSLSDADFATVVDFVVETVVTSNGSGPISRAEITAATGLELPTSDVHRVQAAVIARLQDYPGVLEKLSSSSASRCAEYDACSVHGDLTGATGERLEMYVREKAEDGEHFADFELPVFQAHNLENVAVTTADLGGQPTVLTFLAGHCSHSMDTIPVLQKTLENFGPDGLRVIGVWINSGSAKNVQSWILRFNPEFEVWVHQGVALSDLVNSHLVPTYFFIDEEGNVKEKLVGYKEWDTVNTWIAELMASSNKA